MITEAQMGKLLTESFAPYPNLVLKSDTVVEMTALFQDCVPVRLKKALQNAMFGSGDFFPGPGRIMQEYRLLGEKGDDVSQVKQWADHSDGEACFLSVTTTQRNEKGVEQTTKITYADMTFKALWESRKKNFEAGLWVVFDRTLPTQIRYSYVKWQAGQNSDIYQEAGVSWFCGESLPYLELL